jgi:hypothetical protein
MLFARDLRDDAFILGAEASFIDEPIPVEVSFGCLFL